MIENRPIIDILTQVLLFVGLIFALLPFVLVAVAASHDLRTVNLVPMPLWPGHDFLANMGEAWSRGHFGQRLMTSLVFAVGVAAGKVMIAAISAYSIVYFGYRGRTLIFWLVFITLMLPLEVRVVPTYAVAANVLYPYQAILDAIGLTWLVEAVTGHTINLQLGLLDSYAGLILPLIATATGTFLYRQFFLTLPDELVEAAKMDGAGPIRFFFDVLMPLSRTNIAALFTIMFVWAWNEYLWPLVVTTDPNHRTAIVELRQLVPGTNGIPEWNIAMAGTLLVMLPPLAVVILMQRWFVRGLVATEK
jgi:sn-glycerol 3-phosphate transport system permease protein